MNAFLTVLKVIDGIATIGIIAVKGCEVAESAVKIHNLRTKKGSLNTEEKVELATEIATAVFQTADILAIGDSCIAGKQHAPLFKTIRLSTASMAGIAHISKASVPLLFKGRGVNNENIMHLVGVILFRTTDVTGTACLEPHFGTHIHQACEATHATGNLAAIVLIGYTSRVKLRRSAIVVANWARSGFNRLTGRRTALSLPAAHAGGGSGGSPPCGGGGAVADGRAAASHAGTGTIVAQDEYVPILRTPPEVVTEEQAEDHYDNLVDRVIANWNTLDEIPEDIATVLQCDPMWTDLICPITQKPIRFALSPSSDHKIVYDKKAILQRLDSGQQTPKWPAGLEFSRTNVVKNDFAQHIIDRTLERIATEWAQARANA